MTRGVLLALVTVAASGCQRTPCNFALCDIRAAACQERLGDAVACLREVDTVDVTVRVLSRDDALLAFTGGPPSEEELADFNLWNTALTLVDLSSPVDPDDFASSQIDQIAGWYENTTKTFTVVDHGQRADSPESFATYVHEYAHALQDASFDLGAYLDAYATGFDSAQASASLVEGEATVVQDLAILELAGISESQVSWSEVFDTWRQDARAAADASELPVWTANAHFRYPFGAPVINALRESGGWAAVDAAFAAPPCASREVMFGLDSPPCSRREDLADDAVPDLAPEFELSGTDTLGAWILERLSNGPFVAALVGDVFSVHTRSSDGAIAACWRLRFQDAAGAQALLDDLAGQAGWTAWRDDRDVVLMASTADPGTPFGPGLGFQAVPPEPQGGEGAAESVARLFKHGHGRRLGGAR